MSASQLILRYPDRITLTLNQLHAKSEEAQRRNEQLLRLLTAAQNGDPHHYLSAGIDHGMQAIRYGRRATAELNEAVTLAIQFLRSIEEHDRKIRWERVFKELGRLYASTSIPIILYYRDKLNQFAQQASQHCEVLTRHMQNQWQSAAETFTRGMQYISDQVNLLNETMRQLMDDGHAWLDQTLSQVLAELRRKQEELYRSAAEVQAMVNGMLHDTAQQVQAVLNELQQAVPTLSIMVRDLIVQGSGLYFSTVSKLQSLMDQARQLGEEFAALVARAKITVACLVVQILSELQRIHNEVRRLVEQLRNWVKQELMHLVLEMKRFAQALIEQLQKLKRWIVQVAEQIIELAKKLALEAQKVIQQVLHLFNLMLKIPISLDINRNTYLPLFLFWWCKELFCDLPLVKLFVKEKDAPIDQSQRQPNSDAWLYKQIPSSQSGKIKIATVGKDENGNNRYAVFIPGTDFSDVNKTNNAFSALEESTFFDSAYYKKIVATLLDEFPPDKAQGVEVNFVGHSLGGMVANQLPNDKRLQHLKFGSVTTYGAPRTYDPKEQPRKGVIYKNYIEDEDIIALRGRINLSPHNIVVNTGDHYNVHEGRRNFAAAHVEYDRSELINSMGPSFYIDPCYLDFGDGTFDGIRFKEVKEIDVGTPRR